ncbi:hypothetical protein Athai_45650 [Actinocatenispora thailandica]|uniref:Uncharacterized protein n=1 Tax=Actinocatenispora thailandica TaxID=227318 RepID=A0A7R7DSN4_9ACTN|nr:hypothetical protein [Actinocatenispora thailandica]BCJ37062.1 hypothetical protein Athai_45650 [Actinocatenispora thailandica]
MSSPALAAWRGGFGRAELTARRVAGLLEVPGCARREVLDAAELPLPEVAGLLGCPPPRLSPFVHARRRRFDAVCTDDELAVLLPLVRDGLDLPIDRGRVHQVPGAEVAERAAATRRLLAEQPEHTLLLLRDPVLPLRLGDREQWLTLDALLVTGSRPRHVVALRTFPRQDGVADPAQVAAAAREIAASVLALRALSEVSGRALLVLPENASLRPVAAPLTVTPQLARLTALVRTAGDSARLAELLTDAPALPDPVAGDAPARTAAAVTALPHRFGDGCLRCDLFTFCRGEQETAQAIGRLGTAVGNACASVPTVDAALALADGSRAPAGAAETALADGLSRAARALELAAAR